MNSPTVSFRHTLATLAYRAAKVLRDTPEEFGSYRVAAGARTPGEILAHVSDLLDWAVAQADGRHEWHESTPGAWANDVARFFTALEALDRKAAEAPLQCETEKLFQGPIADTLTHIGQIAMLRRLAGAPVRGENYVIAEIVEGRTGQAQAASVFEFD